MTGYLLKDTKKNQVKIFNKACGGRGRDQNGDRTPRLPGAFRHRDGHLCTGRVVYRQDAPDPRTFCMGRASLTGRPEIRKRSSQSNPEANLRNRQTAVACMAEFRQKDAASGILPTGVHLLVRCRRIFRSCFWWQENTALNHIKKNVPWHILAPSRITNSNPRRRTDCFFFKSKLCIQQEERSGYLIQSGWNRILQRRIRHPAQLLAGT